ncbi:MAG: hypothetical protein JWQ40_2685 [Segetibacter sp.]|jgi:hypothetical protein|nr:hypothetical protein [Segetibacter sp.]
MHEFENALMEILKHICNIVQLVNEGIIMSKKYLLVLLTIILTASAVTAQVNSRKIDTTMKVGRTGYRVVCTNKRPDKNMVNISPVGFGKDVQSFSLEIKGTVNSAETDDLNQDGYPDLVVYLVASDSMHMANVLAVINEKNESVAPAIFPDIRDDAKLSVGYKGNDTLYLMQGNLVRRFPVDQPDTTSTHTGTLIRLVQYRVARAEGGRYKFTPVRTYQYAKQ